MKLPRFPRREGGRTCVLLRTRQRPATAPSGTTTDVSSARQAPGDWTYAGKPALGRVADPQPEGQRPQPPKSLA